METRDGIRSFRDRLHLNQVELAEKLGMVQGNITAWESGRGTPSFQVSKKLFEMGITVEELFGVEYEKIHKYAKPELLDAESKLEKRLIAVESELEEFKSLKARLDELETKKAAPVPLREPPVKAQAG